MSRKYTRSLLWLSCTAALTAGVAVAQTGSSGTGTQAGSGQSGSGQSGTTTSGAGTAMPPMGTPATQAQDGVPGTRAGMNSPASPRYMSEMSAADFATALAASNQFEIATSELALKRSKRQDVQRFARQMITDHRNAATKLNAAARTANLATPSPGLTPDQQDKLTQLSSTPQGRFDDLYITVQREAHEKAVAMVSAYAARGDNPTLRQLASTLRPTLEQHRDQINAMSGGTNVRMDGQNQSGTTGNRPR